MGVFCLLAVFVGNTSLAQAPASDETKNPADTLNSQFVYQKYVPFTKSNYCSCVMFTKAMTGYDKPVGMAKYWPINSDVPVQFGVVITSESFAGHTAYILLVEENRIYVDEANYLSCRRSQRWIELDDPAILGFWI